MAPRSLKLAALGGAAAAAAALASFGPIVRHEAGRVADRFGADITVESVTPTWLGVRLRGVDVTIADVPSATVHLDEVDVRYSTAGRSVILRGGDVRAVGPRERVVREIETWRAHHTARDSGESSGTKSNNEFDGLSVVWQNQAQSPTEAVSARDLKLVRDDGAFRIAASKGFVAVGPARVDFVAGRVELARTAAGYRLRALAADGLDATLALPASNAAPAATEENPQAGTQSAKAAPATVASRGEAIRASLLRVAHAVDELLDPSAKVHIAGVHTRITRGDDTLNLGPGQLDVTRDGGGLVVELAPELGAQPASTAPGKANAEQALTFRLSVPLTGAGEIVADVNGGPIGLSTLGVKEGDFGLFDVGRASLVTRSHVVLSADGRTLRFDGEGKAHAVSIRNAALSDEPIAGLELAFRAKTELDLDGSRLRLEDGEVDLGAIRLSAQGAYDRVKDAHRVHAKFEIPLTACQSMLDSAPRGLVAKLSGMRIAGSFAIKGVADFDTSNLDKNYRVDWNVSNTCRVTEAPVEVNVQRFRHTFRHTVYAPEGSPVEVESGPETPDWVTEKNISKFMEVAVLTTEDGGFFHHHGFDHEAIKNSIRENLRKMKFVRGASTISMQLAKNLYLDRTKNLARKLQEAVLTMYLEQELTKEQILELYFNVVEFGPMVYGVGAASRHYFNGSANDLSLSQAFYLSSIMPNPKVQHFGEGGAVTPGYMASLRRLMRIAYDRKHLTDEELDEGTRETVVRGSPAPLREPGPPHPIDKEPEIQADPGDVVP